MLLPYTKIYDGPDISGATENLAYIPIHRPGILREVIVKTDEEIVGANAVFGGTKNGVGFASLGNTIPIGEKMNSIPGLNVTLVEGDEIVFELFAGAVSSPISFTLMYETTDAPFVRDEVEFTTGSIANGANAAYEYQECRQMVVFQVETDVPARVRAYATDAFRDADALRVLGTETPDDNCLMEVVTEIGNLFRIAKVPAWLFNGGNPAIAEIYFQITNLSGATDTVTVRLIRIVMEN